MQSKNRSERASRGFTLIELLVVVAIIAVLISILLPALGLAKKQAKQLVCNTNLRSMGQAMMLYADEYDGYTVRAELDTNNPRTDDNVHYSTALIKYLGYDGRISGLFRSRSRRALAAYRETCGKTKIFQCPSFPEPEQKLDYVVNAFPMPYTLRNVRADRRGWRQRGSDPRSQRENQSGADYIKFWKLDDFGRQSPSRFIYLTEAHWSLPATITRDWPFFHDIFFASQIPFGAFPRSSDDKRHPGGINASFFDGSARTMGFTAIDVGWPEKLQFRLKWFTVVPPEIEP